MKKVLVVIAMLVSSLYANAFEFDGIDLNQPYSKVAQEISKRGYSFNHDKNCLQGKCQGEDIYLSFNYVDVTKPGMLGQLIVDIPVNSQEGYDQLETVMNVIYHRIAVDSLSVTYQVDKDGTALTVVQKEGFVRLTYSTPFYKTSKK